MKITNQLSENEFVIDLGDTPVDNNNTHVLVAHDYVMFKKLGVISTDDSKHKKSIYGKHAFCSNIVKIPVLCQVGINQMGSVIVPMLNERKEMKTEHYSRYTYNDTTVTFYNEAGEKMISIPDGSGKFETISVALYQKIKSSK
jgi:hypothetical protein